MEIIFFILAIPAAAFLNSWSISVAQTTAFTPKGTGRRLLLEIVSVLFGVAAFTIFGLAIIGIVK